MENNMQNLKIKRNKLISIRVNDKLLAGVLDNINKNDYFRWLLGLNSSKILSTGDLLELLLLSVDDIEFGKFAERYKNFELEFKK